MCNMDQGTIPAPPVLPAGPLYPPGGHIKPPPLPPPMMGRGGDKQFDLPKTTRGGSVRSRGSQTGGFRLMDNQDETGSVYSVYKQKIDSLFQSPTNQVEAVIERMFSDVASTQSSAIPRPSYPSHSFSVDYLGSVALVEKVTSLAGLQGPLRELYMAYRKRGGAREECRGKLEICGEGLRVVRAGEIADGNQINPFPTIAVWSAVKFVVQGSHSRPTSCAFLPLITDPDSMDKKGLFTPLSDKERRYLSSGNGSHSPLFTVVMRRKGVNRQLQCHGFVCQTSEDAIVIAATLYKSLMYHMKSKEKRLKNRNGVTCMSVASSSYNEISGMSGSGPSRPPRKKRSTSSSVISETDILDMVSDTQPLLSPSKKPPKKSIKSRRAPKAPPPPPPLPKPSTSKHQNDLDAILPYVEPVEICKKENGQEAVQEKPEEVVEEFKEIKPKKISTLITKEQKQIAAEIKQVMSAGTGRPLRRVQSVRTGDEDEGGVRKGDSGGDILTKVTIPRSGSFLNTGGLTRYKSKICRKNGQATGGSPLGFTELFNEFRLQEGLNSFDEILGAIIDPEGMSFNDLKPIYKEFLLKLAVTLTKDELYQRSKAIMRRQRKKLMKKNNSHKSHAHMSIGNKFKRLKHVFQKSLKMKLSKKVNLKEKNSQDLKKPKIESSISSSSYDTRHFVPIEVPSSKKPSSRRKSNNDPRHSTSEESDFFSVKRSRKNQNQNLPMNQNRNSSSGYVSCSECSYDSESCTCVSADKCYCSLGNKNVPKSPGRPKTHSANCRLNPCRLNEKCYCSIENSLSFCECDTDSCAESNKCYCQMSLKNQNAKKKNFPKDLITGSTKHKACQKANIKTTRSLEYMQNPSERYFVKLKGKSKDVEYRRGPFFSQGREDGRRREYGMDYELFSIVDDLEGLSDKFSRSLNESRGVDLHRSVKSYSSYRSGSKGKTIKSTAITSGACTEALSVKKTAEIAALFSDIKLSQTTDITHLAPKSMVESLMNQQNAYDKHVYYSKSKKTGREMSNGSQRGKSGMYSAKNGLYTIQSQSDDSHNSSGGNKNCNGGSKRCGREYYNDVGKIGGTLENTLGYLP